MLKDRALLAGRDDLETRGFALARLELRETNALMLIDQTLPDYAPLVVDFLSGPLLHRLKNGLTRSQPMSRALGLKSYRGGAGPNVLDATAGMGTDAFIMSAMGCHVRAVERSPVIFELLQDGLERLRAASDQHANDKSARPVRARVNLQEVATRLSFENAVSHDLMTTLGRGDRAVCPDVIYLDPMYPEEGRSKSALPKKEMQIFRRLLGDDIDAEALLNLALKAARQRVVVKRPIYAPALGGRPTHSFDGKTARFDMYLAGV